MKKLFISILFISAINLHAASNPNGVSVHFSTGYNPTGMGLTSFMNKPFNANFNTSMSYKSIFETTLFPPMSLNEYNNRFDSVDSKNSYSTGTAFSSGLKFNFLKFLFLRSEFTYDTNNYLPIYYNAKIKYSGLMWEPAEGAEVTYQFSYESMSVPLVFGLNIPVELNNRYKADVYIGAGATWTMTKYIIVIDAPSGLVNNGGMQQSSFKENLEFNIMTYGYTWTIGADYQIYSNLKFFMEADSFIYNSVFSETKYKSNTMLTTTTGGPKTEIDLSHTLVKMGVSYKFSDLIRNYFF